MTDLIRALNSELFKLRRTLALRLAIVIPVVMVLLQFSVALSRGAEFMARVDNPVVWFGNQTIFMWSFLMLPLFVCLETTLISGVDHSGNNWKHLFALPVSRAALYTAKQLSCLGVVALGQVVLVVLLIFAELLLGWFNPDMGIAWPIPWVYFLGRAALAFSGALLIIAFHTWLSMKWPSFAVSVGVGIAMTVVGLIVMNSGWSAYYPWTIPAELLRRSEEAGVTLRLIGWSAGGGMLVYLLGMLEIRRREIF